MTKVLYEGDADVLEVDGVSIPAGVETEIDDKLAKRLKDYPGVTFANVAPPPQTSHKEL